MSLKVSGGLLLPWRVPRDCDNNANSIEFNVRKLTSGGGIVTFNEIVKL